MHKEIKEQLAKDLTVAKKNPRKNCSHCGKTNLVLNEAELLYLCKDCKFVMPIQTKVALWWSSCKRCHAKILITKDAETTHSCHNTRDLA